MPRKFFGGRPTPDYLEGAQNARSTKARTLLVKILEDLDPSNFTLRDIQESFNANTTVGDTSDAEVVAVNFGQDSLNILQQKKLIAYDPNSKTYHVTEEAETFAYPKQKDDDPDGIEEKDIRDFHEFKREHRE